MLPSQVKVQTVQIGANAVAASQSRKRKSAKLKDAVFSAEGKAICAVTAKEETMARAKKLKPAKLIPKRLRNKSQTTATPPRTPILCIQEIFGSSKDPR